MAKVQKSTRIANLPLAEREVAKAVIGWLRMRGWLALRLNAGAVRGITGNSFMRLQPKGCPDWVALRYDRQPLFLEFKKSHGGKLSADQLAFHEDLTRRSLRVWVVSNINEFLKMADELF